jgi:hypothetical protein
MWHLISEFSFSVRISEEEYDPRTHLSIHTALRLQQETNLKRNFSKQLTN